MGVHRAFGGYGHIGGGGVDIHFFAPRSLSIVDNQRVFFESAAS
jgi:hypothetical protein